MALKFWAMLKNLKSFIMLNCSLTKQVYFQNPILVSLEKKKKKSRMRKINNQKNFLNLEKVVEKIVHFNRWWDSKWPVERVKKLVQRE
jgi:hypothetical protein